MKKVLSLVLISLLLMTPMGVGFQRLSKQQEIQPQAMNATIKWTYTIGAWGFVNFQSPCVADLDGDGKLEILIGGIGSSNLYCLNSNGTLKWSFFNFGFIIGSDSPTVADLDGDGSFEILFGCRNNFITCINASGSSLWTRNIGTATYLVDCLTLAVADLDGDGKMEIIVSSSDSTNPSTTAQVHCINCTGAIQWSYATDSQITSSPAVGDLDNDGKIDVVVVSLNTGTVYCLSHTGTLKWSLQLEQLPLGWVQSSPAIADLEGDGTLEIIVCSLNNQTYCIRNTGILKWNRTTPAGIDWSSPAIADLDGDGKLEIAVGLWSGDVLCLNYNGTIRWMEQLPSIYNDSTWPIFSSPAIADLDGDGIQEIVIGSSDNFTFCLTDALKGDVVWSCQTGFVVESSPCIADLDGDGIFEILISSDDCILYCLDVTGVSSSGCAPWYCFRGSSFRTGQGDSDCDYLDDVTEGFYGTNPNLWDTDGDGYSDGQEVFAGTDPLNPASFPSWPTTTPPPTTSTPPPTTSTPPTTPTTPTTTTPTTPTTTPTSTTTSGFISYITIFMAIVSLATIATVSLIIYRRRK